MNKLKNIAILICDLQTKTLKNLHNSQKIISNTNLLLESKNHLDNIKITIGSQLNSAKLGGLSPDLNLSDIDIIHNKNTYSMVNNELLGILKSKKIEEVILTGMELQWCINQTTRDLTKLNFITNIPIDAVGNNLTEVENKYNIEHLKFNGGKLCTTKSIIAEQLSHFNDDASKWFVNFLKNEKL